MSRSCRASTNGLEKAKTAFELKGWTQEYLAGASGCSRPIVNKFFARRPVEMRLFQAICTELSLEWGDIADLESESEQLSRSDKDEIIQKMSDTTQVLTNKKSYAFAIAGTVSPEDIAKLKAIAALLKELAQDTSIKIIDIEPGSIKLILEGSQQGLKRLEALFKSGRLEDVLGVSVEDVEFVALNNSNSNQQQLVFTIAGDVADSEIAILKAALTEASDDTVSKKNIQQSAISQDYSGQNLRGRSFKDQNLEGANFSSADIRGAKFTNANLSRANFSHVKAGLQKRWAIFLVSVSWLLSGVSGFFSAVTGVLVSDIFNASNLEALIAGWAALIGVIIVFIVILRQGLSSSIATAIIAVGLLVAGAYPTAVVAITIAIVTAVAIAIAIAIATAIAGAVVRVVAFGFAIAGSVAFGFAIAGSGAVAYTVAGAVAYTVAVALLSAYIGQRAMKGDEKHAIIRNIAIAFAAFGGTSFGNTNLTDANFTAAILKSTDFRKANLTRTCFNRAKKLDLVRSGTTYLQNKLVVSVLVTRQGRDKIFDGHDLRGVNFQSAYLVDASFIGADLSGANLKYADLSGAKLVQAQLDGTDFTGAALTGAYIEDWYITSNTKFDWVRCEYVFMRFPTKENPNPHRKPDNRQEVFADGEFGDFIKPIVDTLDLYHNQGVDPRAIAISFKQLAENHPDADLRIVGMEMRGEDKFLLRAKTTATSNKFQLNAEYFEIYNQLKASAEQELKALMVEKDSRVRSLEKMIKTVQKPPSFYASSLYQVNTAVAGDRNINIRSGGNFNERIEGDYIEGNYYVAGQPRSLAQSAAEIQQLLRQLEQTYPTTTTSQQMVVAAEAINYIESNPTLKKRVINAFKEGGLAAFEKAIDNPAGAFIVAAIKGWQEVNAED